MQVSFHWAAQEWGGEKGSMGKVFNGVVEGEDGVDQAQEGAESAVLAHTKSYPPSQAPKPNTEPSRHAPVI